MQEFIDTRYVPSGGRIVRSDQADFGAYHCMAVQPFLRHTRLRAKHTGNPRTTTSQVLFSSKLRFPLNDTILNPGSSTTIALSGISL